MRRKVLFVVPFLYPFNNLLPLRAISGFNINSVSYERLGPVFDNDYGLMSSFNLPDIFVLELDSSKWVYT